ncbi:MAG: N-formylglutamate amidohydrolase [Emcibacter sp.]|nr:N-formylglutamate amidohydrolase [Emcibacter sp.]
MHPYSICYPECEQNGILFNSPHSGTGLSKEFLKQIIIDPDLIHRSGDIMVDDLIHNVSKFGAIRFTNHFSRSYVDTNRSSREIEPDMFQNQNKDNDFDRTAKVARGFGIFSCKSYNNQEIYAGKLPESEINHRMTKIYHPVHKALSETLDRLRQKHGFYILLDCHSMPSYQFINHFSNTGLSHTSQPDLIIGDCFDKSCSKDLSQHVAKYFTHHGLKVTFNTPYSGGFNTQNYGKPQDNRHALQLEFNRALYMDEETLLPHNGFRPLQAVITRLSENLNDNLGGLFPLEKRF